MQTWIKGPPKVLFALAIAAMIILYIAIRAPHYGQPSLNEESVFLLVSKFSVQGHSFKTTTPIGDCGDNIIRENPSHPSTHFFVFHLYGRLLNLFGLSYGDPEITYWLRVFQSLLLLGGILFAIASLAKSFTLSTWQTIGFAALSVSFASSPFVVGSSIQLQWDGVIGTVPYLLLSAFLLVGPQPRLLSAFAVLTASILVGFDKPERLALWITVRVIAITLTELHFRRLAEYWPLRLSEFAGYGLGALVLFRADPENWLGSISLAKHVVRSGGSSVSDYFDFLNLVMTSVDVLPAIIAIIAAAFLACRIFLWGWKGQPQSKDSLYGLSHRQTELLLSYSGLCLAILIAAAKVRVIGDAFPRYLSPALIPVAIVTFGLLMARLNLTGRRLGKGFAVFFAVPVAALGINLVELKKLSGRSITSTFTRDLSHPIHCPPTLGHEGKCLLKIPYECAPLGYQYDFVLRENAPSTGAQCSLPFCPAEQ
jgi:hypothetical protein